jgi:hypothetical protein
MRRGHQWKQVVERMRSGRACRALHQLGQTRAGRQELGATNLQHEELPTLPTVRDEQFVREVLARVVQDLQEGSRGKPHKADRDA